MKYTFLLCAALLSTTLAQARTVEKCSCVDHDWDVEAAWENFRKYPILRVGTISSPFQNFSCCSLGRDDALAKRDMTWARIEPSLRDIRDRWSSLFEEKKRFSTLLRLLDLGTEFQDLCYEMNSTCLDLSEAYSCSAMRRATGRSCGDYGFGPVHILEADRKIELSSYVASLDTLHRKVDTVASALEEAYKKCLWEHKCLQTNYEYGLLCQHQKKYWKSAHLMSSYVQCAKELDGGAVPAEAYANLSDSYQMMFQYDEAIDALTEAIEKYPDRKELYERRIAAYFELGKTDEAIQDFLAAKMDDHLVPDPSRGIQARAFAAGASNGLAEGLQEFPLSFLYSLRGVGQLLWAGTSNPIGVPSTFMDGLQGVIDAFKDKEFGEILQVVAPEMYALATSWDSLPKDDRWEKLGFVFGKYGFDMFSSMGVRKVQQTFLKLRSTNALCNVKTLASSDGKDSVNSASEQIAAKRKVLFEQSKIQWDRQGKHVEGHNSRNTLTPRDKKTYSILTHKDPEGLLREYAGKGSPQPIRGGEPWETGYKEEVNFKQPIGIWKSRDGMESKETTWGRIHYSKDGFAHIVPIKPKDEP